MSGATSPSDTDIGLSFYRLRGWLERNPDGGTEAIHPQDLRNVLHHAGPTDPVSIVPPTCTGISLSFDPGVLHVSKDGSGYIAIDEGHFSLEDDRADGPDGPEGSVHWITRLNASEVVALRDFLNGVTSEAEECWRLVEALRNKSEGAGVTICAPNADFGGPNEVVEVCADWTDWNVTRFPGETVLHCLRDACRQAGIE